MRKSLTGLEENRDVPFISQDKSESIRACPNSPFHHVYGDCFSFGGREWYCCECGIEWRASLRTGNMTYFQIYPNGNVRPLKKIALTQFPEIQQALDKPNKYIC